MLGETLTPQQVGSVECGRVYRLCGNRVMCPLGVGDGVPLPPLFIHALIPVASVLLPPRSILIHALRPPADGRRCRYPGCRVADQQPRASQLSMM